MMKKLLLLLLCFTTSAHAGEGIQQLLAFSRQLQSLSADFIQTTFDEQMRELDVSTGKVYMQKPGQFRWDYIAPFQQQIISDGKNLYIYDIDLEQVTIKPFAHALGTAPISLLSDVADLQKQFKIIELGKIDGRQMLQLEAVVKDTDYHHFLLALGEDGLQAMELKDKLGQVTRIEFKQCQFNTSLDKKIFAFTAPDGVDIIRAQ